MFGSNYWRQSEILLQSLHEMNHEYEKKFIAGKNSLIQRLQSLYILVFGIPEIGFQVRGMYFRDALKTLKNFSPNKILDIGSGIGCYTFYLGKYFHESRITGWDIDRDKLHVAATLTKKFKATNVDFKYGNIAKNISSKNLYDFLITIDVLEHVVDYKKALKNMYAMTRKGGYIYIHVPQEKQRRFFPQFKHWEHEDHVREGFTKKKLSKELSDLGFTVIQVKNSFGLFGSFAWELHHLFLSKNQVLLACMYPLLYLLSCLDIYTRNGKGLCLAILAQKKK